MVGRLRSFATAYTEYYCSQSKQKILTDCRFIVELKSNIGIKIPLSIK